MKRDRIIRLTNRISLIAIILLLYWVFIFAVSEVFGFKVFRENITESFYLSIIGILAVLMGAVIVNVMFNLTKISEVLGAREAATAEPASRRKTGPLVLFLLSFPIIFLLLFLGDLRTSGNKERSLVKSARYMLSNNTRIIEHLGDYRFNREYAEDAAAGLKVLSKEDESFPSVRVIVSDSIEGKALFLSFGQHYYEPWDKHDDKTDYIYSCSAAEREYLKSVFEGRSLKHRFSAADGHYELYYPVKTKKGSIVLYFTDRKRYGKY